MTFETFNEILTLMRNHSEKEDQAYKINIVLYDFNDDHCKVINILLKEIFGQENLDWIEWFLYEKGDNNKAYDGNNIEICKDIKELWDIVSKK